MKQLFKIALCVAAFAASIDVFAEILPISPTEGSIVPLLSASQKKLKEFSSPEERKKQLKRIFRKKRSISAKKGYSRVRPLSCFHGDAPPTSQDRIVS